ncbi:MAG: hypothetical protein COT74_09865 [Bdellovibrionales bacterium CG10_big_fil_rev_8_21_14_0_10_45_34]|nr:MAG: hypothetical protein COT74_09865 [Bdellovibrionales bacterium CG10_big_fil_rev_8_21_14_0_10_45_34]
MNNLKFLFVLLMGLSFAGCATSGKNIALGMLAGAVVGAAVGNQFVHHGQQKQFETQNTIITAAIFSVATGGVLAWHYRQLEYQQTEISGRYARYRLCDPKDMDPDLARRLNLGDTETGTTCKISGKEIGSSAISLDDSTKWVYPVFRKRYLLPDQNDNEVTSSRYIWQIIRPGSFVTRSRNPRYFIETQKDENLPPRSTGREETPNGQ